MNRQHYATTIVATILILLSCILPMNLGAQVGTNSIPDHNRQAASEIATFADFPIGSERSVQIMIDPQTAAANISQREQAEQVLDWLLYAVVSSSGLSQQRISEALFDVPVVRYGYRQYLGAPEYGVTRSCYVGSGIVIAVVPKSDTGCLRIDHLARIADEHRKNTGSIPDTIQVFEYTIDSTVSMAVLRHGVPVLARTLYTAESGYREQTVADVNDLRAFLGATQDLTYARYLNGRLVLGGRRLLGRELRGVTLDHVAALWRATRHVNDRWQGLNSDLLRKQEEIRQDVEHRNDDLYKQYTDRNDAIASSSDSILAAIREKYRVLVNAIINLDISDRERHVKLERLAKAMEREVDDLPNRLRRMSEANRRWYKRKSETLNKSYQLAVDRSRKSLMEGAAKRGLVMGLGFSLDPTLQPDSLKRFYADSVAPTLLNDVRQCVISASSVRNLERLVHTGNPATVPALRKILLQRGRTWLKRIEEGDSAAVDLMWGILLRGSTERLDSSAHVMLDSHTTLLSGNRYRRAVILQTALQQEPNFRRLCLRGLADWEDPLLQHCFYQRARYDGDLQGTVVGMNLFYCDLLAKLWTLNCRSSAPVRELAPAISSSTMDIPPLYLEDMERFPSTRLWFGVFDNGFQVDGDSNAVLWGRKGTRVFAKGTVVFATTESDTVNPLNAESIRWWNNYFEEIGRFEPRYEELNQVMKWSVLVAWISDSTRENALRFLDLLPVDTSQWFSSWVRTQQGLRFRGWDSLGFHNRGYNGESWETLRTLISAVGEQSGTVVPAEGGVLLASRFKMLERTVLKRTIPDWLRRPLSGAVRDMEMVGKGDFVGPQYKVIASDAGAAPRISVIPRERLMGPTAEVRSREFIRTLEKGTRDVRLQTEADGTVQSELRIGWSQREISIRFDARQGEQAQELGRQLSKAGEWNVPKIEGGIAKDVTAVDRRISGTLRNTREYMIKSRDSKNWVRAGREGELAGTPDARVVSPAPHSSVVDLKSMTAEEADGVFESAKYVQLGEEPYALISQPAPVANEIAGMSQVKVQMRGQIFNVRVDHITGKVYVPVKDLSANMRAELGSTRKFFGDHGIREIQQAARSGRRELEIATDINPELLNSPDALLRAHDFEMAGRKIEALIEQHGELRELVFRRAVAELAMGRSRDAAAWANRAVMADAPCGPRFLNEVNDLLQSDALNEAGRRNLYELASLATTKMEGATAAIHGDRLGVEVFLDQLPSRASLRTDGSSLFVQDKTSVYVAEDLLSHVEYSPPFLNMQEPGAFGDVVKAFNLPRGSIAGLDPVAYHMPDNQVLKLIGESPLEQAQATLSPELRWREFPLSMPVDSNRIGVMSASVTGW
ncbi:MAG: hypothetical protein JST22_03955 [Bacteroidetes bacterium]|nr:hypothetical protein [Bacteroidota bacterium]